MSSTKELQRSKRISKKIRVICGPTQNPQIFLFKKKKKNPKKKPKKILKNPRGGKKEKGKKTPGGSGRTGPARPPPAWI